MMAQTTINQRLKILIEMLGLSVRAFSAVLEVPDTNTRNYLDKGTKLNSDYIQRIAHHFQQVSIPWLITGNGEPLLKGPDGMVALDPQVKNNSGQRIKNNHGTATNNSYTITDCEKERDGYKAERDQARAENELLRQQLTMAQALLEAKEETLSLLRAGYNRSN